MNTSIFIKTCRKDLEWLKYCARSIQKFGWGFSEVVVVADESCRGLLDGTPAVVSKIEYVPEWIEGRIQQQAYKLLADTYCSSENILFVDSDCVFTMPFSPADFMKEEKPILLKTRYEKCGSGIVWKKPTQRWLGWEVEWEYMRRMPMAFRSETLTALRNKYPVWHERLKRVRDNMFSEFNVIGAYAERYEPEKYFITDTEVWTPPSVCRQFWSWGGFTEEVMAEIRQILFEKS